MTDPVAAPVVQETPAPVASIQQLTIADIIAKINVMLTDEENGYGMSADAVAKIEQFSFWQMPDGTPRGVEVRIGELMPGSDSLKILRMYRGEQNERIADHMQGDIRVYAVPLTVVTPGAREYRRITLSQVMVKNLVDRMTFDAFVEAIAFEDVSMAEIQGLLEDDEEDETPALAVVK